MQSLSLGQGAVVVAVLSFLAALAWAFAPSRAVRWIGGLVTPAVISYCLYRYPVWRGANPSEYSAWFLVCFIPWFFSGAVISGAVLFVFRRPAGT